MNKIDRAHIKESRAVRSIISETHKASLNIGLKSLIIVYLLIILGLGLTVPKIYLRSKIYYLSKDVGVLYTKYQVLEEENDHLKQQLEAIKFKNQVLDTIF